MAAPSGGRHSSNQNRRKEQLIMQSITYETIEQSVLDLDLDFTPAGANAAIPDVVSTTQRLIAVYRAVRPILNVVAALPLVPPQFRTPLQLFIATLDQFTAGVSETDAFKAGKDL
jgi:hypothetical protein